MIDVGDGANGFSVAFDRMTQTLQVAGWGFWSSEVAGKFAPAIASAFAKQMCAAVVFDLGRLAPMRDEGQEGWCRSLRLLVGRVRKVTIATGSTLTKLQLLRLSKQFDKELALQWVELDRGGMA